MSKRPETIVCLSTRVWHSLWRNTQQIMWRLTSTHRIVFVEPQRDPDLSFAQHFRRASRYFGEVVTDQVAPNLVVVRTPPALPYARRNLPRQVLQLTVPAVARINNKLMAWHLRRVLSRLRVRDPILWLYEPRQAGLIGHLGEKLVVYFNYDELADFAPNHRIRDLLRAYDEALTRRADVVFASSQALYQRHVELNANTYFVPNGVDYDLFCRALEPATATPPELRRLQRPILGFVGWLGHQLDVPLLVRLARAYPECSLVLVGPDALEKDAAYHELRAQPNVLFTGRKQLDELPSYLKAFDVALLPYKLTGHTHAIYPLKLHEYLASGRSVLATNMPELQSFSDYVRVAPDAESFLRLVPEALADNGPERRSERTRLARQHTWEQRVAVVQQALEKHSTALENRQDVRAVAGSPGQQSLVRPGGGP